MDRRPIVTRAHGAERRPGARRAALALALLAACSAPGGPSEPATSRPLRLGLPGPERPDLDVSPLSYGTGFLAKTFVYETLLRIDAAGRPGPALARRAEPSEGGRVWTLTLRPGARFHDGTPCDAAAVARHVERWRRDPAHAWVPAATLIERIEVLDPETLRVVLSRPHALAHDLLLVNPTAVAGEPRDDGLPPPGTGPWRFVSVDLTDRIVLERTDGDDAGRRLELVFVAPHGAASRALTAALRRGEVDAIVDAWTPVVPRDELWDLTVAGDFTLQHVAGSTVTSIAFAPDSARGADIAWRRRVAGAVDRLELAAVARHGFADPCATLFAPAVADWPAEATVPDPAATDVPTAARPAVLLLAEDDPAQVRVGAALQRQLAEAGIAVELLPASPGEQARALAEGGWDLRLVQGWGLPYDPVATLRARFTPPAEALTALTSPPWFVGEPLRSRVEEALTAVDAEALAASWPEIQALVTELVAVVPLYVDRRVAVHAREVEGLRLGHDPYRLEPGRRAVSPRPSRTAATGRGRP